MPAGVPSFNLKFRASTAGAGPLRLLLPVVGQGPWGVVPAAALGPAGSGCHYHRTILERPGRVQLEVTP